MTDIVKTEIRSRMMSNIRSRNTAPELLVRSYLHSAGFRFRLHRRDLPGHPDIVLPFWRVAIQVQGCFWHGHAGCRFFKLPGTRAEFWARKLAANVQRDKATARALRLLGWRTVVIWECSLKQKRDKSLRRLERFITSERSSIEI
jgi:DNA mismatch endonuclease (patch repair protein)